MLMIFYSLIGFFVITNETLISFGLNIKYRKKDELECFFSFIKKMMQIGFRCILWNKNVRAIKWLINMGMVIENNNTPYMGDYITTLNY